VERDDVNQGVMADLGWIVMVVWECELRDIEALAAKLTRIGGEHAPVPR
jgi:G:T-mismatch repair DNA endonuclease (very short patch repair protein)